MASRDIRSTKERVDELNAIIKKLRVIVAGCKSVQTAYDKSNRSGGNNYEDLHANAQDSLDDLAALLEQTRDELTAFINNNGMVFQCEWQGGRNNAEYGIQFTQSQISCAVASSGASALRAFTLGGYATSMALSAGNMIKVTGSVSNDGYHQLSIVNSAFLSSTTIQTEATNRLAKIVFSMTDNGAGS